MSIRKLFILLALVFLMVSLPLAARIPLQNSFFQLTRPPAKMEQLESLLQTSFPFSDLFRNLYTGIRLLGGATELNGIFLAQDGLIENFMPTTDSSIQRKNIRSLITFAQKHPQTPTALMLIPTASAIYSNRLPSLTPININQKTYLESMYKTFAGNMAVVDVYPVLFSERNSYLYYRTHPLLTTRGGYVVYQSLARRLGFRPKEEQEFSQQFLSYRYYGSLYDRWGVGGVQPDSIIAYHYQTQRRAFQVRHINGSEVKTYYSLYPTQAQFGPSGLRGMILGGNSPMIRIQSLQGSNLLGSLLVIGDENCLSFLPFLALHYNSITYVSTSLIEPWEIERIDLSQYKQVLFSFSLETFINTDEPTIASRCGDSLLP